MYHKSPNLKDPKRIELKEEIDKVLLERKEDLSFETIEYVNYVLRNAGKTGLTKILRRIKKEFSLPEGTFSKRCLIIVTGETFKVKNELKERGYN
jgi:hypothetical protein